MTLGHNWKKLSCGGNDLWISEAPPSPDPMQPACTYQTVHMGAFESCVPTETESPDHWDRDFQIGNRRGILLACRSQRRRGVRKWVVSSVGPTPSAAPITEDTAPPAMMQLIEWLIRGLRHVSHVSSENIGPVTDLAPWARGSASLPDPCLCVDPGG